MNADIKRFLGWMKSLQDRRGRLTGSIGLWILDEESNDSYTLILTEEGVQLKQPGLRHADLVLSMKSSFFRAWLSGDLDLASVPAGEFAWDGDIRLFRELGYRMSHAPKSPHQILLQPDSF